MLLRARCDVKWNILCYGEQFTLRPRMRATRMDTLPKAASATDDSDREEIQEWLEAFDEKLNFDG